MSTDRVALSRIRRSPAAAGEILRALVAERYLIGILEAFAHSIQVAHRASPSKWGLRLKRNSVMLKVGFVEVLQVGDSWFHELILGSAIPQTLRQKARLRFGSPPYKNAPGCETCDMPLSQAAAAYRALRPAHEEAIRVAARSRRHTTTTNDHSPGLIIFLANQLGVRLPQPEYLDQALGASHAIPEEIPADEEFNEGAVTQVLVNRYERDPAARARCLEHYGTACFVCGLALAEKYGPEVGELIHVHHLTPISSVGETASVDPVRDLRPVCPNCHAVIHFAKPPRSIQQVQAMLSDARGAQPVVPADGPRSAHSARG